MPTIPTLADRSYRALDAQIVQYERRIARELRVALDAIRADLVRIYDKYAVNGVLTHAEMTKYNRLAALEKQVLGHVTPAVRATVTEIRRLGPDVYEQAFFRAGWTIDNGAGIRLDWGPLKREQVLAAVTNEMSKIAIENYRQTTTAPFRRAINQGLLQGKSYTAMARDLKHAVDMKAYQAIRIARTEGQTAINAGTDLAYNEAMEQGVEMGVQWMATLDDATRDSHGEMDGVMRDDDGIFRPINAPYPAWEGLPAEERINCRCNTIPVIEGFEPGLRRTRDEGVGPYQSYEEWKRGQ